MGILISHCVFCIEPYLLQEKQYVVFQPDFVSHIYHYKDSLNKSTIESVITQDFQQLKKNAIFSTSKYTNWFKVVLQNNSTNNLWLFEILDPHIQHIQVYQVSGNEVLNFRNTGYISKFSSRSADHKNYLFPIKIAPGETTTLFFTFSNNYPTTLIVGLRPAMQFVNYALFEYYLLGIFYGVLLIMALYNFFIFFSTGERVYIYYVAYVICYCLNAFQEDGLGFQYLWPNYPKINMWLNLLSPMLLVIAFVVYSKKFLFIQKYSKSLNHSINFALLVYCILYLINTNYLQNSTLRYFYLIPFALVFFAGCVTWKRGNKSARYFLLAFSALIVFLTIVVLRINNLVPTNIYTVYALNFGFLVEVVLFSYALGLRLRIGKEENAKADKELIVHLIENEKLKDSLNKNLEEKVLERTQALAHALEEIKFKNEEVEKLNNLLESDNKVLHQDIKEITKARLMLKDLTLDEFKKIYPDEDACLKYLAEIKWMKPYKCKKCESTTFFAGKTSYARRCTKCGYDESVTTNTLFHNSKIPINDTFYLVHLVLANRNISSQELSDKLNMRQKTCWAFKKKVLEAIEKSGNTKLNSKEWGKIFYI